MLTIKTPGVFIFNFEHISHLVLVFLLLTLNMQLLAGFQVIYVKLTFRIPLVSRRPASREQSHSRLEKKKATPKKERGSEDKLDSPQPPTDYDEKVKSNHESNVTIELISKGVPLKILLKFKKNTQNMSVLV